MVTLSLTKEARIYRKLYQKKNHNAHNHDSVITHLEPDILECAVNWALGRVTTNKASRGDEIPIELSKILKKMML